MSGPLRPLAQLLVDAVSPEAAGSADLDLGDLGVEDVARAAHLHRVAPAVAVALARRDDAERWAALQHLRREQIMRHMRAREDLARTASALDAAGIAWVAVKGPVLSDLIWPRPDMREYYDLDLVVDRRRFGDALTVLADAGCEEVDRNWPMLRETMRAEVAMKAPYGTALDLHWDVAVPQGLRRDFATDIDGVLERSRRVALGDGRQVPTPDPVDTVLHLAFHAAHSGVSRLVWLADVAFAMGTLAPGEADVLAERARQWRAEVPLALVVERAESVLSGVAEAPAVVRRPARRGWGRVVRAWDDRSAFPGLPGDAHLGGTLYSAARRSVVGSARSAWASRRHVAAAERDHARRAPTAVGALARPLREDVPDARARAEYLRIVETAQAP